MGNAERRLEDANETKKNLAMQLAALQKKEEMWLKAEREMGAELKELRKERLLLVQDGEEIRRKATRFETERREVDSARARLEREVAALKKHIEAVSFLHGGGETVGAGKGEGRSRC